MNRRRAGRGRIALLGLAAFLLLGAGMGLGSYLTMSHLKVAVLCAFPGFGS